MKSRDELETALSALLPVSKRNYVNLLANIIFDLIQNEDLNSDKIVNPIELKEPLLSTLEELAGKSIRSGEAVISFGTGAQVGDITVRDMTLGSIFNIYIDRTISKTESSTHISGVIYSLCPPIGDFKGRGKEIEEILSFVTKNSPEDRTSKIIIIRGMPGIGKTELAHVVAYHLCGFCNDGQYSIKARSLLNEAITPEKALRLLMRSLNQKDGLPEKMDVEELRGLYLTRLTGKRALIFVDDAMTSEQIQALIPPKGNILLITSRNRLNLQGKLSIDLDVLSTNEAKYLLTDICSRIAPWAEDIARICGNLPLALRIVAGNLEANPDIDIPDYIKKLEQEALLLLNDPDNPEKPDASVEASIKLSFDTLPQSVQDVLCKISKLPETFPREVAREMLVGSGDIEEALSLLVRCSLIGWDESVQQYRVHTLIRSFAGKHFQMRAGVWGEDLSFARDDVQAIFEDLQGFGSSGQFSKVFTLSEEHATQENLLHALSMVAPQRDQDEDSTFIIYFSGHGGQIEHTPEEDEVLDTKAKEYLSPQERSRTNMFVFFIIGGVLLGVALIVLFVLLDVL